MKQPVMYTFILKLTCENGELSYKGPGDEAKAEGFSFFDLVETRIATVNSQVFS